MLTVSIRQEAPEDQVTVHQVIKRAFADVAESDQSEAEMVDRLRLSDAFIPELSLVAVKNDEIVGHILFTKLVIRSGELAFEGALALAPVSVDPAHQGQGIGGRLIEEGHAIARRLGYAGVVLLGHAGYYPRFGYERASGFGIQSPWEVPDENYMALELVPGGLKTARGLVEYPRAFFE